ncbi:MAG: glycyl-radical enzyme activating protein [Victivallales bacterium]|nr:glycyl-radical enzyme activating protein [Victivallales bacterium]
MATKDTVGIVFEVREFCVHDGPGVRTTVFLKGCPLRCAWCQNPEGQSFEPQLLVSGKECVHCGACLRVCPHGGKNCTVCGACVHVCPQGCRRLCGTRMTAAELAARVMKDADFLRQSGGGVTFSGGEPMAQADFVCEAIERMRPLHVAVETSGYAPHDVYRQVIEAVDLVYQDVKIVDDEAHQRWTGADNHQILENIAWLKTSGKPFVARIPLIPGVTDTAENFTAIAELLRGSRNLLEIQLLPYNFAAGAKYALVGREYKPSFNEKTPVNTDLTAFQQALLPCRVM